MGRMWRRWNTHTHQNLNLIALQIITICAYSGRFKSNHQRGRSIQTPQMFQKVYCTWKCVHYEVDVQYIPQLTGFKCARRWCAAIWRRRSCFWGKNTPFCFGTLRELTHTHIWDTICSRQTPQNGFQCRKDNGIYKRRAKSIQTKCACGRHMNALSMCWLCIHNDAAFNAFSICLFIYLC